MTTKRVLVWVVAPILLLMLGWPLIRLVQDHLCAAGVSDLEARTQLLERELEAVHLGVQEWQDRLLSTLAPPLQKIVMEYINSKYAAAGKEVLLTPYGPIGVPTAGTVELWFGLPDYRPAEVVLRWDGSLWVVVDYRERERED